MVNCNRERGRAYCRKYYRKNREKLLADIKKRRKERRTALGLRCTVCGKPIPMDWRSSVSCSPECALVRKRSQVKNHHRACRSKQVSNETEDWQQAVIEVMNLPATERWQYARHWGDRERNFAKRIEERRISIDRRINREVFWGNT